MTPQHDLFANFERMRREIDELFGDVFERQTGLRGRQLLIAGERRPAAATGRLYQQIEIEHGPFRRIVELGAEVEAGAARASYEDGMLAVEIPLARPEQTVRRVPIEEG